MILGIDGFVVTVLQLAVGSAVLLFAGVGLGLTDSLKGAGRVGLALLAFVVGLGGIFFLTGASLRLFPEMSSQDQGYGQDLGYGLLVMLPTLIVAFGALLSAEGFHMSKALMRGFSRVAAH